MRSMPSRGVMASQGIANPSYLLGSASSILVDSAIRRGGRVWFITVVLKTIERKLPGFESLSLLGIMPLPSRGDTVFLLKWHYGRTSYNWKYALTPNQRGVCSIRTGLASLTYLPGVEKVSSYVAFISAALFVSQN